MQIRSYEERDFDGVAEVYANAKLDELRFEAQPFVLAPLKEDAIILAAFKASNVLVCDDNGIIGFAASVPGLLRALFVHSDARGRGAGSALLKAVLEKEDGPLSLNVAKSNEPAIAFYEKFGFVSDVETIRKYSDIDIVYRKMDRLRPT
ncbi:GNAT family N-acetyltransferase [Pseudoduganella aquatica]|uniref:GNAT family N-acetyltransferase n=1 Tax=Pseudoduganella aquatica TaxID=2660641 RepID=A0A7X4H8N4_9BURK|nr:GNAT family N-acetyltransferase [Pseudoduganella aquatica]MYN06304.1 GNAT family N-acetyltransferase [Pseudoduganella aquatica]